jgi:hypothetical protein
MFVSSHARGSRVFVAVMLLAALVAAVALGSAAEASTDSPVASAAAKKCSGGKVLVRRPGRSSVCAKKCPAGKKRKVSARGKVSCVKKAGRVDSGPTPAPPAPPADAPQPPAPTGGGEPTGGGGPKEGGYSGETEQSRPVTFKVVGNEVQNFEAGVNTWCNTMYNNRLNFDAIANVPPMAIGPDGSFSYEGTSDEGNPKITGKVTGGTATGTVGMMRGDSNYSGGQLYFGQCSASDMKWNATAG